MDFKIEGNSIILKEQPKKIKKITGTRFASILGLNPWQTDFQAWADMTGFYKEPFEENKYTNAGKTIEPLVINYLDKRYYFGKNLLKTPFDWFGKTTQQMSFDHFHDQRILGGMWDARTHDTIYELKTTKRVEDWYKNNVLDAPEYYKLQAALYAYLCGLDKFKLVLTTIEETDYDNPENFIPSTQNTFILGYSLSKEYPQFEKLIENVLIWHEKHILTGRSPDFDNKKDAEALKEVRTQKIEPLSDENTINAILSELEPLQKRIEEIESQTKDYEKQVKTLKEQLKKELKSMMKDTDKKIVADGSVYTWELSLQAGGLDSTKLKKEQPEIYEKYQKSTLTEKLTQKLKEVI